MKMHVESSRIVLNLYKYKKASEFLLDYFNEQKAQSRTWSYENWSRKLKQKKSTVLRTVCGRIPMSETLSEAFCRYFKFSSENRRYFELISICERLQKLYPGVMIDLPEINDHKKANFKLTKAADKPTVSSRWIALPEVGWLLLLFSGKGVKLSAISQIKSFFHKGLGNIDFDQIINTCLNLRILEKRGHYIVYQGLDNIYLDSEISGLDIAIKRYMTVLSSFKLMIEADVRSGLPPEINNRACSLRMKKERLNEVYKEIDTSLKNIYATFQDLSGDSVVDLQCFVAPVAIFQRINR